MVTSEVRQREAVEMNTGSLVQINCNPNMYRRCRSSIIYDPLT